MSECEYSMTLDKEPGDWKEMEIEITVHWGGVGKPKKLT